jgi:hypothetical protein
MVRSRRKSRKSHTLNGDLEKNAEKVRVFGRRSDLLGGGFWDALDRTPVTLGRDPVWFGTHFDLLWVVPRPTLDGTPTCFGWNFGPLWIELRVSAERAPGDFGS